MSRCAGFYEENEEPIPEELEAMDEAELFLKMTQPAGEQVLVYGRVFVCGISAAERILKEWFQGKGRDSFASDGVYKAYLKENMSRVQNMVSAIWANAISAAGEPSRIM